MVSYTNEYVFCQTKLFLNLSSSSNDETIIVHPTVQTFQFPLQVKVFLRINCLHKVS